MKKKIFLTSAAVFLLASNAFAIKNANSSSTVNYDAIEAGTTGVPGTGEIMKTKSQMTYTIAKGGQDLWEFGVTLNTTTSNSGQLSNYNYLSLLTPVSYTGDNILLESWIKELTTYPYTNQSYIYAYADIFEYNENTGNDDIINTNNYARYKEFLETFIPNNTLPTTGKGSRPGEGVWRGAEVKAKGRDYDDIDNKVQDNIYFYCKWTADGTLTECKAIYGLNTYINYNVNYVDCYQNYEIRTIPAGFIDDKARSLSFPSTVTTIADGAFDNASNLTSITETSANFEVETALDGTQYLFEVDNSGNKTLVFATASTKVTVLDWDETYVGIKDNALKFRSNLTINTENPISYTSAKGANTVVQKKASTEPASWDFSTGDYTVTESINATDMANIINDAITYNCTYVDMTGADVTEDLDIDAICEANSKDFSNLNTIFFFPASTHTVTGKNVVVDGNCANLVLTEAADFFSPYNFDAASVTYNRTISTNWSTVCLPFSVTGAQLINNFKFGVFDSYEKSANSFTFELAGVEGQITANVPYIIKSREGNKPLSFTNVSVSSTIGENLITPANEAAFIGTYEGVVLSGDDDYEYYGFSSNVIKRANGTTCKRFRAYLRGPKDAWTYAGSLRIVDASGDEKEILEFTTGIENVKTFEAEAAIYNVNGQKLNEAKGLVVKNGTKMIIK